jgi:hypothetical protein
MLIMKTNTNNGMPTANIAINKSRIKLYNADKNDPTYFLKKGQEFQIELFNPTTNNIIAKIKLNGNAIAQGGLMLKPGERVFLDRYLDVAKKFLFETYNVEGDNDEVKKAIKDNGDFSVSFHMERIIFNTQRQILGGPDYWSDRLYINNNSGDSGNSIPLSNFTTTSSNTNNAFYNQNMSYGNLLDVKGSTAEGTLTTNSIEVSDIQHDVLRSKSTKGQLKSRRRISKSIPKSIETGRVGKGSTSNQEMVSVEKDWEPLAFHSVEYKLLPISQKVNTVSDIKKKYCTNCGTKQKTTFKFCPSCGDRV